MCYSSVRLVKSIKCVGTGGEVVIEKTDVQHNFFVEQQTKECVKQPSLQYITTKMYISCFTLYNCS